jgi:hypothetical protein
MGKHPKANYWSLHDIHKNSIPGRGVASQKEIFNREILDETTDCCTL